MADAAPGLDLSPSPSPSASGTSSRRQALDSLVALAVGVPTFAKGGERLLHRTPPEVRGFFCAGVSLEAAPGRRSDGPRRPVRAAAGGPSRRGHEGLTPRWLGRGSLWQVGSSKSPGESRTGSLRHCEWTSSILAGRIRLPVTAVEAHVSHAVWRGPWARPPQIAIGHCGTPGSVARRPDPDTGPVAVAVADAHPGSVCHRRCRRPAPMRSVVHVNWSDLCASPHGPMASRRRGSNSCASVSGTPARRANTPALQTGREKLGCRCPPASVGRRLLHRNRNRGRRRPEPIGASTTAGRDRERDVGTSSP